MIKNALTFSGLNLPLIVIFIYYKLKLLSQISNSILVDKDDLKWVANEKKSLLLKQFHENVRSKTLRFWKLRHSPEMDINALMHRGGLRSYQTKDVSPMLV